MPLLMSLTACVAPLPAYISPANSSPQAVATIDGSDIPARTVPSLLFGHQLLSEIRIGVLQIDHQEVGSQNSEGSSPVQVTAGRHLILFGVYYVDRPGERRRPKRARVFCTVQKLPCGLSLLYFCII
jgi:hypothetical protein